MKDATCFPDERDVAGAGRDAPGVPCACLRPPAPPAPPRVTSQVTVVLTLAHESDTALERAVQRALDRAAEVLDLDLEARDVELVALRVGTVAYGAGGGK